MAWISTPQSSNISGFEYHPGSRTLTIEFKAGARYNYFDVPEQIFNELNAAASKGTYHAQAIKNRFRYARV